MAWEEPKTDWIASDYYNITDFSRMVGNIEVLAELVDKLHHPLSITAISTAKDYSSFIYASEFNSIENNLEKVNDYNFNIGKTQSYMVNGKTPNYTEFNRIESASLKIHEYLLAERDNCQRLEFTLGGAKKL